ncbi:hypothetical protein IH601_04975 [Candidatus Bipolaricaulota bacterium]|nr:hypothetical protein [Candidatus Bipolaricaulota bacterium]TFH09745.1 MAG: hypothetical protein E4H08_05145 [Candidatus Atribacteria bacterium]
MHKRLLLIGLLVVGMALLCGCDLLDQIIDSITGGTTPGGGTTTPGAITSVSIGYSLDATISERIMPAYPVATSPGSVVAATGPKTGSYNAATKTFTATWDNAVGNFSNTYMEVTLNATEEYVESFYMRQTQSNVWFAWTFMNEIRGMHVLDRYGSATDNPRTYEVDGVQVQDIVELLTYKGWARESEGYSAANPIEWINSKADIIPRLSNVITITVYR